MTKALALFSGGLDSMLAVEVIRSQNIKILAINFETPFYGGDKVLKAAEHINVELRTIDFTDTIIEILKMNFQRLQP